MTTIGYATLRIIPSMRGTAGIMVRESAGAGEQAGAEAGRSFGNSFSNGLRGIGSKLTGVGIGATAAVTAPLALLGKHVFDAASDLNESLSKAGVVFGDWAIDVEQFAMRAATSLGISRQEALESASTFGNLFKSLGGFDNGTIMDMSTGMVTLASDLASFNNVPVGDVLTALQSGLVGELEPMRRFGVALNAETVELKAMELGLVDANGEVTEAGKVQARYALIMEGTATAQGDFARTAGGAANQQRILRARFADTAATLGQSLLPIGQQVLGWVTGLFEKFNKLSPQTKKYILIAAALAAALGPVVTIVGALVTAIGFLISPVGLVILAIAALVAGVIYAYTHFESFRETVDSVLEDVREGISGFVDIVQALWERFGSHILQYLEGVWITVSSIFQGAFDVIMGIWNVFAGIFTGDWSRVWDGIQQIFGGIVDAILGIVEGFVTSMGGLFGGMMEAIKSAVGIGLAAVFFLFVQLPLQIISLFWDAATWLYDAGVRIVKGLYDGIVNAPYNLFKAITDKLPGGVGVGTILGAVGGGIPGAVIGGAVGAISKFHQGGVLGGPRGKEQLFFGLGGETILPTHDPSWDGGGRGAVVHINAAGLPTALVTWLRSVVRVEGGGDVQIALGRAS